MPRPCIVSRLPDLVGCMQAELDVRSADMREVAACQPVFGCVDPQPGVDGALNDIGPTGFVAIDQCYLFGPGGMISKPHGIAGFDDAVDDRGKTPTERREIGIDPDIGHPAKGVVVDQPSAEGSQGFRPVRGKGHRGELCCRAQALSALSDAAMGRRDRGSGHVPEFVEYATNRFLSVAFLEEIEEPFQHQIPHAEFCHDCAMCPDCILTRKGEQSVNNGKVA